MKNIYKNGRHLDQELDKISSEELFKVDDSYDQIIKYSADAVDKMKMMSEDMFDTIGPWDFNCSGKKSTSKTIKPYFDAASPVNDIRKKRRVRENDLKLDLCLDFTACVDPETFQFCPNTCVYSKFKSMVRSLTSQNGKRFWSGNNLNGQPLTKEILKAKINERLNSDAMNNKGLTLASTVDKNNDNLANKIFVKSADTANKIPDFEIMHSNANDSSPRPQLKRLPRVAFANNATPTRPRAYKQPNSQLTSTVKDAHSRSSSSKPSSPDSESKTSPTRLADQRIKTADNALHSFYKKNNLINHTSKKNYKYVKSRPSIPSKTNTFPLTIPDCCGKSLAVSILPPISGHKLLPKTGVKKNFKNA